MTRGEIEKLIERLEKVTKPDRWIDEEIATALGGMVRRVSRLGLSGRTAGSYRVFWPNKEHHGKGSAIPYYTKDEKSRAKALAALKSLEAREP